jgi:hypothetical protein
VHHTCGRINICLRPRAGVRGERENRERRERCQEPVRAHTRTASACLQIHHAPT